MFKNVTKCLSRVNDNSMVTGHQVYINSVANRREERSKELEAGSTAKHKY